MNLKDNKKMKIVYPVIILLMLFNLSLGANGNYQPKLFNEMPEYLLGFKKTVEEQAVKFPEFFYLSSPEQERTVALTFDDGPDSVNTPIILEILKKEGIKATFFLLGQNIIKYPEIVKEIAREGHQIANHTWTHPDLRKLNNNYLLTEELLACSKEIERIIGEYPKVMRPPYGAVRDDTIKLLGEKGWKIVNWSIDTFDWDQSQNSVEAIQHKVEKYIHPGAIILMHDGAGMDSTVRALPGLIEKLRENGYTFRTVTQLLGF